MGYMVPINTGEVKLDNSKVTGDGTGHIREPYS